jgi:predicted hydrolase (HD superfamily)
MLLSMLVGTAIAVARLSLGRTGRIPLVGLVELLSDEHGHQRLIDVQWSTEHLASLGVPDEWQQAILGHAEYTGVPRTTPMARALFAVDELSGFLVACALVRPSKSLQDLEVSSVKKKLKDKGFAKGVSREDIAKGVEELGTTLDEHIAFVLDALRPHERSLGLGG